MVVADIILGPRKPPPLHTDEDVRAIGMPDLKPGRPEGDIEEHWLFVWNAILAMLHFFGAPSAIYQTCGHRMKQRKPALDYLRAVEAMIRRILLIMAGADKRPLEPWMPRAHPKRKQDPPPDPACVRAFRPSPCPSTLC